MYVFKNALRNISRAKGRSLLVFILVLVIAVSACVALSIKSSADQAKDLSYESMQVTAQIGIDRESMMSQMGDSKDKSQMMGMMSAGITIDEAGIYAQAQSVQDFYYNSTIGLNSAEVEPYETSENGFSPMGSMMGKGGSSSDFSVTGFSSHNAMTDFISGTTTIVDGEVFDESDTSNTCLISSEVAFLNDLVVGDTIELYNPSNEEELIQFTVCGTFQCESTDSFSNDIYVSIDSLNSICQNSESVKIDVVDERSGETTSSALTSRPTITYVLSSPDDLAIFEKEVAELGLDTETYAVTSNDVTEFEKSMLPLENLSNFTLIFFIVVLIIGAIILVVFNLFTVRERKYEIGVLAAIGMQKPKVAIQFISEVLVITFVAVTIGAGIGAVISQPLGDVLLETQVEAVQDEGTNVNANFGGNFGGRPGKTELSMPNAQVDYVDEISTTINLSVIIQLLAIGLLLALFASSVGVISILRYEPLKILSERA